MNDVYNKILLSSTLVSIVAIIAMMTCSLSALGYNSKIIVEKEKIEVSAHSNSDSK